MYLLALVTKVGKLLLLLEDLNPLTQRRTNPGRKDAGASKLVTVAPNISGSYV